MIANFREQRVAIKFCILFGNTDKETIEIPKEANKDDVMAKTQVFE